MKKILISGVVASILTTGSALASEDNGVFLGFQLGTGVNANFTINTQNIAQIVGAFGIRGGYQAFFSDINGIRVYLSALAALGFSAAIEKPSDLANGSQNFSLLGDIDVDYLVNFVSDNAYTFGMYIGFFAGVLYNQPVQIALFPRIGSHYVAPAIGINLGLRATVSEHNQFEFGIKVAPSWYNNTGSRSYKPIKSYKWI